MKLKRQDVLLLAGLAAGAVVGLLGSWMLERLPERI